MYTNISTDISIKELLKSYPQLLRMFMDMKLMCVGCPAEEFHTLADVSREYGLDLNQLLQRVYKIIEDDKSSQGTAHPKIDG